MECVVAKTSRACRYVDVGMWMEPDGGRPRATEYAIAVFHNRLICERPNRCAGAVLFYPACMSLLHTGPRAGGRRPIGHTSW